MKVLLSSLSFHPEHSGSAPYSTDLAVYLAEKGHDVTVVTGFPFYPGWRKRPEDRRKLFASERYKGVKILRGYLYVPENPSALKRVLHELSFTAFALLNFLRAGRHERVVITAAPISLQLMSLVFMSLWRAPLVIHIQDLQSDAALSLGMVRLAFLGKLLTRVEAWIYQRASAVVTITPSMKENLKRKGVPEDKLVVYPNWIDLAEIDRLVESREGGEFRAMHPVARDKFVVAYAGNIGVKQGLEVMVELARASRSHTSIHYFVIGEGSRRVEIEALARRQGLTNITFVPFLAQDSYLQMLRDIDVSFISQRSGSGDVFFPGKLLGIMAMRKPVVVCADLDSELAKVVSEAECGLVADPNDIGSLLQNVVRLYEEPERRKALGENGYAYVRSYDRERILSGFLARISRP